MTTLEDVTQALADLQIAKATAVQARISAHAEVAPLFETVNKLRAEAVLAEQAAMEKHGVAATAKAMRAAEEKSDRLMKQWASDLWADVRCSVPTNGPSTDPQTTVADALARAGVKA